MESRDQSVAPAQPNENSEANPQNTSQTPTTPDALASIHQPLPPITTELPRAPDSKGQDSPSPQSNEETLDEDEDDWNLSPPAADYRRNTVLVRTPAMIDEKQPLISQSTSSSSQGIDLALFSGSGVSPTQVKPMKEVSDVKTIFNLTPEQAHQAISAYCQESKEQESEKQHRIQSFVAYEIREAFLRSYTNLHNQGNESGALPESMQQAAKPLIDRYAQIKSEWEQTLRDINRDLVKDKDIAVEDKPFKWLLHYYEWLSRNGTSDEASKIYKELVGFEIFDGYEEDFAKQTDLKLNAESSSLMLDWPTVLRDASLKMVAELKSVQTLHSSPIANTDGAQSLALVSRPVFAAIPVYYSPDEIEAYFKEKEKREKEASQGGYVRSALYARFLELKNKREQAEKEINFHGKRITEAADLRERYIKTLNQQLRDEGVFDPNLSGNELLMHFQRLYFEERVRVSGSKTQVVYARKGTPETDKRYRKLIAAKRKLDQIGMQLDDYCNSSQTRQLFLSKSLKKEGRLDLLTEDRSRPVDAVEEYMIRRGRLEPPAKQAIPLPSMLDALAEHCEKTVCVWSRKQAGQQELQPLHYYVPTQSSGEVIHLLREGNTYRQLHKEKDDDIVIESGSTVNERYNVIRHFREFKAHRYQDDQGQRYYTSISSNPIEEEGFDQQVLQPASSTVNPAYPDICRWRDRFFWEAVVAINKAIKKGLGNEGDDALLLLEILLGENSKKAQEGYQDVHQEYLFESVYQETFLKLITMIKSALMLHGEQRPEPYFIHYQQAVRDSTVVYAKEVQENGILIAELQQELSIAMSAFDKNQREVIINECELPAKTLLNCDVEVLELEEKLNLLPFADYEKSSLHVQVDKARLQRIDMERALTQFEKKSVIILLQNRLAMAERWKQQWGNDFNKWLAKEISDFERMQEKYQELWNISKPKELNDHPAVFHDTTNGKAGTEKRLDILSGNESGYYRLAAASYARMMKHVPAHPLQNNLNVGERRETLDELTRQINIAIASFLPELKHRMEQVMAGFQMDIHYPLSETTKNTNAAHAIAEQFVERLKHWALNFLQGNLDHNSAHGIYVMQFQSTGNLNDFIVSMQQCIATTEKEVATLATAARNCSDLSHDAETSATQVYLAESREWVSKKTKLLPFYYQNHGQYTRSPEQMVQDIQATRIGALSLAHIALENTGDTLMHFALLAYNKVQGKQKERLFKIIAMLFARDADSNVKNMHNKPQTARQLAKLKLTVPADLKFVTVELEHQKHYNDFEADVAKKLMQYSRETYTKFSSRGFIERLIFAFKRSAKELQTRRVRDVQVMTEMLHDARHRLDDSQLNQLLQFMLQNEEARLVHGGELQAKFHSTVANVNSVASKMTYYGPLIQPKIEITKQVVEKAENQEQKKEQGAAKEKQITTKEKQIISEEKQITAEARKRSDQAQERRATLHQRWEVLRKKSKEMSMRLTGGGNPGRLTQIEEFLDKAEVLFDEEGSSLVNSPRREDSSANLVERRRAYSFFGNSSSSAVSATVRPVEGSTFGAEEKRVTENRKPPKLN